MIKPEDIKGSDERAEQTRLFAWAAIARAEYPQLKWLHAIPNANSHHGVAEGVRAGVADMFLPVPKYQWHGLYIEMKLEKRRGQANGGCSKEQVDFGKYCFENNYLWYVCYGWQEAKQRIEEYLK